MAEHEVLRADLCAGVTNGIKPLSGVIQGASRILGVGDQLEVKDPPRRGLCPSVEEEDGYPWHGLYSSLFAPKWIRSCPKMVSPDALGWHLVFPA